MERVYYYHQTPSTNRIAYSLARKGAEESIAVIAESQEAGRGRLGKVWQSPPGKGLYCSIIVRPHLAVEDYSKITLTAGLAVADVLEQITGHEMRLKWPNDVYASGKKCCGILTESSSLTEEPSKRFAIIGIGININSKLSDFPVELHEKVVSLKILTGKEFDIMRIFMQVKMMVLQKINQLQEQGFDEILREWRKRDMLAGRWLQWLTNSGQVVYGLCEGPDDSGRLLIKDAAGNIHDVLSGDISLARTVAEKEG
jgi:BirA family biotin operon repressor/biotin-[acetyl-CoA-carboxylase] ligase